MTYIDLINHFWDIDEDWQFTCCETRLYFYLLKTANRLGWVDSWTRSDTKVSSDVGVSVKTMKTARNRLMQAGLIEVYPGGKGQRDKTKYAIRREFRCENLPPKGIPKRQPKGIPKGQPKGIPNTIYKVRALDKDKDIDKEISLSGEKEKLEKPFPGKEEELPLEECHQYILSHYSQWIEQTTMNIRNAGHKDFTVDDFLEYMNKFFIKLQNEGEETKPPGDAKKHFYNWLKIQLESINDGAHKQENERLLNEQPDGVYRKFVKMVKDNAPYCFANMRMPSEKEVADFKSKCSSTIKIRDALLQIENNINLRSSRELLGQTIRDQLKFNEKYGTD